MEEKFYPVVERRGAKSLLFHIRFERRYYRTKKDAFGGTVKVEDFLPRAGIVIASFDRLCSFMSSLRATPDLMSKFDMRRNGLYWEHTHRERLYIHPYLDIDIKGMPPAMDCVGFHHVFEHVARACGMLNARLTELCDDDAPELTTAIYFNTRLVANRRKYSFHIHWPRVIVSDLLAMRRLVDWVNLHVPNLPVWNNDTNTMVPSPTKGLLDDTVYKENQLFRLPMCGKFGDATAAMVMIDTDNNNTPNGQWVYTDINDTPNPPSLKLQFDWSCPFTPFNEGFTEIVIPSDGTTSFSRPSIIPNHNGTHGHAGEETGTFRNRWLRFWDPVIKKMVLPNFFRKRMDVASQLQAEHVTHPDPENLVVGKFEIVRGYECTYRVSVVGDHFCEYDVGDTPHAHPDSPQVISYLIDIFNGKIAQHCRKCNPPGNRLIWRFFIQDGGLEFDSLSKEESNCLSSSFVSVHKTANCQRFYLKYFNDNVLYCREASKIYVYDKSRGIWVTGSVGNMLMLDLLDEMNGAYIAYRKQRNVQVMDKTMREWIRINTDASDEECDDERTKQYVLCVKSNRKVDNLWFVPDSYKQKMTTNTKSQGAPHSIERMEPHDHLVPMLNCKCLDIYTFKEIDIRPDHYFTALINGELIDLRDRTCVDLRQWQRNVCCGDEEVLEWKFLIFGLSLTMMNFDRAAYMPLGPMGRNGKGSEAKLMEFATMSATPHRGYNVPREYLTKSAQDRKAANAADTILLDMNTNKSVATADECRDSPMDGALIKWFVSGDSGNARNLYEGERQAITIRICLWIIANKTVKLDYSDAALMDRMRIIPYDAQWVKDVDVVVAKMTDDRKKKYVFKEDPYFKNEILPTWVNAFVTVSLHSLHLYMKSLPADPKNPTRPLSLCSFPVPKAVQDKTNEKRTQQSAVSGFVNDHLTTTLAEDEFITVEDAFENYRHFGDAWQFRATKGQNVQMFIEDMSKEMIDVTEVRRYGERTKVFHGKKLSKPVPRKMVDVPTNYVPAAIGDYPDFHSVMPSKKRPFEDDSCSSGEPHMSKQRTN